MKTLKISTESAKSIKNTTPEKRRTVSILKSILIIFILAMVVGLSSCAVEMRTPRYHPAGIIIGGEYNGEHHVRRERHYRSERHDRRNNDDREEHDR